ncbi:hypothetical protein ABEB36_010140 [Hypothenemus hampei]|uniref:PUM-HD domain-containing protein n=1 Tax=Hypothenemus hampei TaxID=57062 RepID=A0ABD1EIM9_HYPHA
MAELKKQELSSVKNVEKKLVNKRKITDQSRSEIEAKISKKGPDAFNKKKLQNIKNGNPIKLKPAKAKTLHKTKFTKSTTENAKIEDWGKFKKEKKELRLKRIKGRTKDNFDRIQEAKKMGERLRLKTLKNEDRNKVINQLHDLLKGHYAKLVLAHDTARIIQWLLKYSSKIVVSQISRELLPVTVNMLQSKYGIHCVKGLLKYGEDDFKSSIVDQMSGHIVKLVSHTVSAPVVEYAMSSTATTGQKQLLIQEFYGDWYKNSKFPLIKHIRDVYKNDETMKAATLGSCKVNLKKVLNKSLLDSGLVQTVLSQFLEECSVEDRAELITELASHIVVISNSRDGSKAAMQCIWHGTSKDKKVMMKSLKEHLQELAKHEFGHRTIIALLDSVDDTVLLHKIIISELLNGAKDLAVSEYGRKVLLWLVAPGDTIIFHPNFIKELTQGRESSNSKKPAETRRQEILSYSINNLLNLVIEDTSFWISKGSLAIEMLAILKSGSGNVLEEALCKVAKTITDTQWKIQDGDKEIAGIEHAGIHMTLKKLAKVDKLSIEQGKPTFGSSLLNELSGNVLEHWLKINRGCFLLVAIWENNTNLIKKLKSKLKPYEQLLQSQKTTGADILYKKLLSC